MIEMFGVSRLGRQYEGDVFMLFCIDSRAVVSYWGDNEAYSFRVD